MKKPSADDLHTAAQWLDAYEGVDGDDAQTQACWRVRDWLLHQIDGIALRKACQEAGIPVAQARKAIRRANQPVATNPRSRA